VHDLVVVQVRDGAEEALCDAGGLTLRVGVPLIEVAATAQLQHQKQPILIVERFKCLDNVRVIQLLQNGDCGGSRLR
jgi:hypothetical protein